MRYLLGFFIVMMLVFWVFNQAGCKPSECGHSERINGQTVYDYSDCYDPADHYGY